MYTCRMTGLEATGQGKCTVSVYQGVCAVPEQGNVEERAKHALCFLLMPPSLMAPGALQVRSSPPYQLQLPQG